MRFAVDDVLDAFDVALVVVLLVEDYVFAAIGGAIAVEGLHSFLEELYSISNCTNHNQER